MAERRRHTTGARDAALNKLRQANRAVIIGAVVLTGVLAEAAANAFPGRKSSTTSARSSTGSTLKSPESAPKVYAPGTSAAESSEETGSSTSEPNSTGEPSSSETGESATGEGTTSEPSTGESSSGETSSEGPVVSGGS